MFMLALMIAWVLALVVGASSLLYASTMDRRLIKWLSSLERDLRPFEVAYREAELHRIATWTDIGTILLCVFMATPAVPVLSLALEHFLSIGETSSDMLSSVVTAFALATWVTRCGFRLAVRYMHAMVKGGISVLFAMAAMLYLPAFLFVFVPNPNVSGVALVGLLVGLSAGLIWGFFENEREQAKAVPG